MSLRRNIEGTTRFEEAIISDVSSSKNPLNNITYDSRIQVMFLVKDDDDPEFLDCSGSMSFSVPHVKLKKTKRTVKEVKTDPETMSPILKEVNDLERPLTDEEGCFILDENGDPAYEIKEIEQFIECEVDGDEIPDPDYIDPFDLAEQRKEGVDLHYLGYKWLLKNTALFSGWSFFGTNYQKAE